MNTFDVKNNLITHGVTTLLNSNESINFDPLSSQRVLAGGRANQNVHTKSCKLVSLSIEKQYKPTYFNAGGIINQ